MKLLLISLFLTRIMYSCECVNSNTKIEFSTDNISSLKFDDKTKINNPLIGKKFYYLYKYKGELILFFLYILILKEMMICLQLYLSMIYL